MYELLNELNDELSCVLLNGEEYLLVSSKLKSLLGELIKGNYNNKVLEILKVKAGEFCENFNMIKALELYSFITHIKIILNNEETLEGKKVIPNGMNYEILPLQSVIKYGESRDIRNVEKYINNLEKAGEDRLLKTYIDMKKYNLQEVINQYLNTLDLMKVNIKSKNKFFKYFLSQSNENNIKILKRILSERELPYKRAAFIALSMIEDEREFFFENIDNKELKSVALEGMSLINDREIAEKVYAELKENNFSELFNETLDIISRELLNVLKENIEDRQFIESYKNRMYYFYSHDKSKLAEIHDKKVIKDIKEYLKKWEGDSPWLL